MIRPTDFSVEYYPKPVTENFENLSRFHKKVQVRKLDDKYYVTKMIFHAVQHGYIKMLQDFSKNDIKQRLSILDEVNGYSLLHYACLENHADVVDLLLTYGGNINIEGSKKVRPIHVAAQIGNQEIMELLCQHKSINIDVTDNKGQTALLIACRRGNLDVVNVLLSHKANINKVETDGVSVLHNPVRRNDIFMVKVLIKAGAPLNKKTNNGQTPVMVAAIEGHEEMLEFYLHNAKVQSISPTDLLNEKDNDGYSSISLAVLNRNEKIVKICNTHRAYVNCRQNDGKTIFHTAAVIGFTAIFDLVDHDSSTLNLTDIAVNTPMHLAVINSHLEMVKALVQHNAGKNFCDRHFRTPILVACREIKSSKCAPEIAKFLLDEGADVTIRDEALRNSFHYLVIGEKVDLLKYFISNTSKEFLEKALNSQDFNLDTPLHIAASIGNDEIVKMLLAAGANPIIYGESDILPLHLATKNGHLDCVKVLLEKSEKSSSLRNADEVTPILLAAEQARSDVFKYLISQGKDPFAKDEFGRSSLMFAARSGSLPIVQFIIDMDVNINMMDQFRNTSLHEAVVHGNLPVVEYMWNHGALLSENIFGHTQFDVAIHNKHWDIVRFMLNDNNWKLTMAYRHKNGMGHMKNLFLNNEEIAYNLLDKTVTTNTKNKMDPSYEVKYSFQLLDSGPEDPESISKRYYSIKEIADKKKEVLLSHPTSKKLISLKWKKIGLPIFVVDLLLYLIYLVVLVAYIEINNADKVGHNTTVDSTTGCVSRGNNDYSRKDADAYVITMNSVAYAITGVRLFVQLVKLIGQRHLYFVEVWNYAFLLTGILVFLFIDQPDKKPCLKQWRYAPALIFMSWFNLLYYIEYFPFIGITVILFEKVLKSVIKIMVVFIVLFIGFAYAFYIINDDQTPFRNIGLSMSKIMAMMIGELEIVEYFMSTERKNYYQVGVALVSVFMIVMSISLINLMVGVAVGDIETVMKDAGVESIRLKVNYVYSVESNSLKSMQNYMYFSEIYEQVSGKSKSLQEG